MPDDLLYEVISNLDDYETNKFTADQHSCEVIRREKGLDQLEARDSYLKDSYWLLEEARVTENQPDPNDDDWL